MRETLCVTTNDSQPCRSGLRSARKSFEGFQIVVKLFSSFLHFLEFSLDTLAPASVRHKIAYLLQIDGPLNAFLPSRSGPSFFKSLMTIFGAMREAGEFATRWPAYGHNFKNSSSNLSKGCEIVPTDLYLNQLPASQQKTRWTWLRSSALEDVAEMFDYSAGTLWFKKHVLINNSFFFTITHIKLLDKTTESCAKRDKRSSFLCHLKGFEGMSFPIILDRSLKLGSVPWPRAGSSLYLQVFIFFSPGAVITPITGQTVFETNLLAF